MIPACTWCVIRQGWGLAAFVRPLLEDGPDVFEPLTVNSLTVPGYGGRMYFPMNEGFITLQVKSAAG